MAEEKNMFTMGFRAKLLLTCAVVCIATLSCVFFYLDQRQQSLYLVSMKNQSRALFKQIVITRKWIADHGGVFVEKLPWVNPNPYMENKSITGLSGTEYIRKNPAMVTRELSEYARKQGAYWFHLTSLKPVNPNNAPDAFETNALLSFEASATREAWGVDKIEGHKYYRYMAPLFVEEACLECHARHGYRIGDIRGAISVAIPMEAYYNSLGKERILMAGFAVSVALVLMAGLYVALNMVMIQPIRQLRDFAVSWKERASGKAPSDAAQPECPRNIALQQKDELTDLYTELCSLHSTVTSHQRDLEGKVTEATKELSRINAQLLEARDRYKETSMIKSEFIAAISHELRTPLTSVKGALGYITSKFEDPEFICHEASKDLAPFIDIITRNTNRFAKLVEDTLDLEKIESGHMELHRSEVNMAVILEEARQEFIALASASDVGMDMEVPASLMAYADPDRLRQVMANLIHNALRHSPPGASILLKGARTEDVITVSVIDQGPGIEPEMIEMIFQRFQKGDKGGTGLGLTISRGIVDRLGGRLWAESDGAHGSAFHFTIPITRGRKEECSPQGGEQ